MLWVSINYLPMNWVLILAVVQVILLVFIIKRLGQMEKQTMIKVSEIKAAVVAAAKANKEAFTEIGTKIADLNKQIADLIAGVGDPEVTDEAFEADLRSLQTDAQALADIVPGTATPE